MVFCMAVMARERWTDERLDRAFDRVDVDLRELRVETRRGFEQVDKRFERIDDKLNTMQRETTARFDAMQRNMMIWAIALFSAVVSLDAAILAAIHA